MAKMKPDRYSLDQFNIKWSVVMGKGDAECTAVIKPKGTRSAHTVTITISKWRIDHLGYDRALIIAAASRVLSAGLNSGRYKEITDGIDA